MRLERTLNAKRNIYFGLLNKIITLFLPFFLRTIIIRYLSVEYLGLGSLFSSILGVLNITELGFGSAVVFSMYKAIAENDEDTLCAILKYYKKIYKIIGCIILILGISIMPFLDKLIKGSYPKDINIYFLYVLYFLNSVISYFLFAYRSSLLHAFQRDDIVSNVNSIAKILLYVIQIFILIIFRNFYLYIAVNIVSTIFNNILAMVYSKKLFPQIIPKGNLDNSVKNVIKIKVKGLMISKITGITRNTFDSIFISFFLGLVETAMYNNYYTIMTGVIGFFVILMTSISAGLGNSVVLDSVEKNFEDLNKVNFLYMWLSGFSAVCLFVLYQPFTELFFGKDLMFPMVIPTLFVVYFYLLKMSDVMANYSDALGLWWENKYSCICEAILNIVLNYILGKYFGVYGILFATIISIFFCNFIWSTLILFNNYFHKNRLKSYFKYHLFYLIVTIFNCFIVYFIAQYVRLGGFIGFLIKMIICMFLPNIVYLLLYKNTKIYKHSMPWILQVFHLNNNKIIKKILL